MEFKALLCLTFVLLPACLSPPSFGWIKIQRDETMIKIFSLAIGAISAMTLHAQSEKSGIPIILHSYEFLTPVGWHLQNNADHILIQNMQSGCLIRILVPYPSSGDLELDAKSVFDLMYAGWQYRNSGTDQYTLSKGFLVKGLEYCMWELV